MEVIQITSLSMILLGSLDIDCLFDAASSGALGIYNPLEVAQVARICVWVYSTRGKIGLIDSSANELGWKLGLAFTHLTD
jgi:hypothetical protein